MAVGTALMELRRMLRAEVGQSLNPAQGVNAQGQYDLILARQQKELWDSYEWPHLMLRSDLALSAGQDTYPYPNELPFVAINQAYCWDGVSGHAVTPVDYPTPTLSTSTSRAWPVRSWRNKASYTGGVTVPAGSLVVYPVPSQAGTLILIGLAPCNPLIADTDTAVLDDTLITLFAAAEILAQQKNEGASLKLQKANQYLRRLLANQMSDKQAPSVLGGQQIAEAMLTPSYASGTRHFRIPGES